MCVAMWARIKTGGEQKTTDSFDGRGRNFFEMYKSDDVRGEVLSTKRGERQTPQQQDRLSSSKIGDGRESTNKAKKELLWAVECRRGHRWGKRITTAAAVTTAKEGRRGWWRGERRGRERRRREGSVELWRGVKRNGGKKEERRKKRRAERERKKEKGGGGERE